MKNQPVHDVSHDAKPAPHTANGSAFSYPDQRVAGYRCLRCEQLYPVSIRIDSRGCPTCADIAPSNLRPVYESKTHATTAELASLWRYAAHLPCGGDGAVSLGEGMTPLLPAPRMGELLRVPNLLIKDESRNPTWSYKDRFSTVAVSMARADGHQVLATASSGNAGASLAAYAAKAGLSCVVATFANSAGPMLAQIRKYGATILPLVNKTDRWTLLEEAAW